jgi:hypothetical protein
VNSKPEKRSGWAERWPGDATKAEKDPGQSPAALRLTIAEFAGLFGLPEDIIRERIARASNRQEYYSIGELAGRWRCSRATVYNRLRSAGAKVLDFAAPGKRGKKAVHASVVFGIEAQKTKRLC